MTTYTRCKRCHHEEEVELKYHIGTVLCEWCGVENHYTFVHEKKIISIGDFTIDENTKLILQNGSVDISPIQALSTLHIQEGLNRLLSDRIAEEVDEQFVNGNGGTIRPATRGEVEAAYRYPPIGVISPDEHGFTITGQLTIGEGEDEPSR